MDTVGGFVAELMLAVDAIIADYRSAQGTFTEERPASRNAGCRFVVEVVKGTRASRVGLVRSREPHFLLVRKRRRHGKEKKKRCRGKGLDGTVTRRRQAKQLILVR